MCCINILGQTIENKPILTGINVLGLGANHRSTNHLGAKPMWGEPR